MSGYRFMTLLAFTFTAALFLVVLSGCGPEKTSDTPRPANAPCERCGIRPTLTPGDSR